MAISGGTSVYDFGLDAIGAINYENTQAVPLPAAIFRFGGGFFGLGIFRRFSR